MNITIVGAGNIGTQFAVHCAEKGHNVIIYGSRPEEVQKELEIVDETGKVLHKGIIKKATRVAAEAFSNAEVIFVTMPAYCMKKIALEIAPFVKSHVKIGLVPGTGGGECAFRKCIEKGAVIFGLQRVPSVARLVKYGKQVCAIGYRSELNVGALPSHYGEECRRLVEEIFQIPCNVVKEYLSLTLTPSNPILHTSRLRILFKDYKDGMLYDKVPLFYEEWDNETSELLMRCDEELQCICKKLTMFDLNDVKSLKIHYESDTPEELTDKIRSIKGFKGLKSPVKQIGDKYIPDFSSRYFTADFPYGLFILLQVGNMVNIDIPNMKEVYEWYRSVTDLENEFSFEEYDIKNLSDFKSFYKQ